jgi:hypothetical protein
MATKNRRTRIVREMGTDFKNPVKLIIIIGEDAAFLASKAIFIGRISDEP